MSEESKKILEMLNDGKINVDDAERLLKALGESQPDFAGFAPFSSAKQKALEGMSKIKHKFVKRDCREDGHERSPRFLRVEVNSADGDEVDIKLPLGVIKAGLKLSAIMPKGTEEKLAEKGINIAELMSLESDELIQALSDLEVNIQSANGDDVNIYAE